MDTTILYKYLNNEASEAETEAVFAWIAASPEHKREFMLKNRLGFNRSNADGCRDFKS